MISLYKSINELYSDLCIRLRDVEKSEQNGTAICQWCKEKRSNHLSDGRCSSWACSQVFVPQFDAQKKKIVRALELIEELRSIDA